MHRCGNSTTKPAVYDLVKRARISPTMAPKPRNHVRVVALFMGTRPDLAPHPLPFVWACECCNAATYSAAEPPPEQRLVCHVCASQLTAMAEQDPKTHVAWRMTEEGEDILSDIAEEKQRPVEEVYHRFLEWQLGRPLKVTLYRKPEKKVQK
jgi:hypothetical protein